MLICLKEKMFKNICERKFWGDFDFFFFFAFFEHKFEQKFKYFSWESLSFIYG